MTKCIENGVQVNLYASVPPSQWLALQQARGSIAGTSTTGASTLFAPSADSRELNLLEGRTAVVKLRSRRPVNTSNADASFPQNLQKAARSRVRHSHKDIPRRFRSARQGRRVQTQLHILATTRNFQPRYEPAKGAKRRPQMAHIIAGMPCWMPLHGAHRPSSLYDICLLGSFSLLRGDEPLSPICYMSTVYGSNVPLFAVRPKEAIKIVETREQAEKEHSKISNGTGFSAAQQRRRGARHKSPSTETTLQREGQALPDSQGHGPPIPAPRTARRAKNEFPLEVKSTAKPKFRRKSAFPRRVHRRSRWKNTPQRTQVHPTERPHRERHRAKFRKTHHEIRKSAEITKLPAARAVRRFPAQAQRRRVRGKCAQHARRSLRAACVEGVLCEKGQTWRNEATQKEERGRRQTEALTVRATPCPRWCPAYAPTPCRVVFLRRVAFEEYHRAPPRPRIDSCIAKSTSGPNSQHAKGTHPQ
ncbi:hypothetical protein PLICRDRAFT_25667 [Plicaturopsis crispa FD-325 SS-3]|nr:hypothetical protein PLICRDRAFT_25667 [Plicaturopsis crispa FD-325 SS-3]